MLTRPKTRRASRVRQVLPTGWPHAHGSDGTTRVRRGPMSWRANRPCCCPIRLARTRRLDTRILRHDRILAVDGRAIVWEQLIGLGCVFDDYWLAKLVLQAAAMQ